MATGIFDRQERLPSLEELLSRHGLEKKDLDGRYPAEMRLEIAQLLDDWKMIGYYFGFTSQKLNDIEVDNHREERRRVALLDAWEQREGEGATYLKLAEALHHRERADLFEKLCGRVRRVREEMKVLLLDKSTPTPGIKSCVYVKQRLDSLEDKISKLSKQLLQDLEGESITADDILDELTLLPVALRREYQESIKKEMHSVMLHVESSASRSIRYVFRLLINPLTTFLDYKLLEHLISKFGNTKLQRDMAYYVDDVNKFKHETTVAELMDYWDGIEDHDQSLNYTELKVRFGEDPSEYTLESLDKRRRRFCSRYRLSELVMVLIHLKPGSFIAVWRIPTLIVGKLMESIGQMDNTFFDEDNIQSIFIAGKQAYPIKNVSYGDVRYAIEPEMQIHTYQDTEEALLSQADYQTEGDWLTSRFQPLAIDKHWGSSPTIDSGIGGNTYSGRSTTTGSTGYSKASSLTESQITSVVQKHSFGSGSSNGESEESVSETAGFYNVSQGDRFQRQSRILKSTSMSLTSTLMSQRDQLQRFLMLSSIDTSQFMFDAGWRTGYYHPNALHQHQRSYDPTNGGHYQPRLALPSTSMGQRDQFQEQPRVLTSGLIHGRISGWRTGESAPSIMYGCESGAVISGNLVYFNPSKSKEIYVYDHTLTTNCWSRLPDCPHMWCSLAAINGFLTTIGGGYPPTNTLFSLIGGSSGGLIWNKTIFPPMPTKRQRTISLCAGKSLIVAGGWGSGNTLLKTVEILSTETYQWSRVIDLPQPVSNASATLCDNDIYVVERHNRSVYTCSMSNLLESCNSSSSSQLKSELQSSTKVTVWKRIDDVPLRNTTCVSFHDKLLVVGGVNPRLETTRSSTAIHMYGSATDSWNIVSNMPTARSLCFAAVLPDNQLMVVGGIVYSPTARSTDSVEFAAFT